MSECTDCEEPTPNPRNPMAENETVSRADYARLQADYDNTLEALREAIEEADALKAKVAELEPFKAQASDLSAKARGLEAARAYDKIADELGVKPEFRDDVWKLAGFAPEGDELDEKKLRDHMTKFLADRKAYTKAGDADKKTFPKGEGASHGGSDPGFGDGDARRKVTHRQLMDPDFTSKNADFLADTSKYEIVEA